MSNSPNASDDNDESGEVKSERNPESSLQETGNQPIARNEIVKPSQRTVATWRRSDDDMEPSAKMIALVEQLHIAQAAGDKTIVYSQCE